jgi:hypothetical protein
VKRSQAERLIDEMREMAAQTDRTYTATDLGDWLAQHNVPPLEVCEGEAHSNAFIDNCSLCAPRWGFVGKREKVT